MKTKRIQINQLHMPLSHTKEEVIQKAVKTAGIPKQAVLSHRILRRSVDARKKPEVFYSYRVELTIPESQRYARSRNISVSEPVEYAPDLSGAERFIHPPVIAGMGPAGLFAGYLLAKAGCSPILLERGKPVEERLYDVEVFWKTGCLDPSSNVQFGEGGAGTFSDGKLNTGVKDRFGRNRFVLETFVRFGAPEDILYDAKPHIGTDILVRVIANMREELLSLGAEICYGSALTGIVRNGQSLTGVIVNQERHIETDACVLCVGHSARDTFRMLHAEEVPMEAKAFAVGLRIEHPQEDLDQAQYGSAARDLLPRAAYKLTGRTASGRSAYTFCMCPGGYVVNASSEENGIVVNGMSDRAQDSPNANSAVVLTVPVTEFSDCQDPLSGISYQQNLEEKTWTLGKGRIPQQLFADFEKNKLSTAYGSFASCAKGETVFADLRSIFTEEMNDSLSEAIHLFGKKIQNFDRPDAILSGVESRTSSPVRITRDESCQSTLRGLYPCGEGAGYAGGITSAAMDGLKCAEAVLRTKNTIP